MIYLSQEYGVYYLDNVFFARASSNTFHWNAAVEGTGIYIDSSRIHFLNNDFRQQISIKGGSAYKSYGDNLRQVFEKENMLNMIGAVIEVEGGTDEGLSMSYFYLINMRNCGANDAGYMKFVRSGGVHCYLCTFTADEDFGPAKLVGLMNPGR